MKIDDRVRYSDEVLAGDEVLFGTVAEPTEDERRAARESNDGGYGPDYGDVMVEWDDGDRYWEQPSDLVVVEEVDS